MLAQADSAMRELLVIAFHFPPDNTSTGVLRTHKFTEYLLCNGWASEVVSVPVSLYPGTNPDVALPEHIRVRRVWAADIKYLFGKKGYYPELLAFPDRYWPWFFAAARAGARLIHAAKIDAIYSTYPVATAHLIGLYLKARFKLPWVADFRDPWVEDSLSPFRRWAEGNLERRVIEKADRVICNTPAMRRSFVKRYPSVAADKFVTIPNGYDEPDFAAIEPEPVAKFEILHPGLIDDENRDPEPLLAGIGMAIERGWLDRADLQITFLGTGNHADTAKFQSDLDRYRVRDLVAVTKQRIPYAQALRRLAGADVLVVLSEPVGGGRQAELDSAWTAMQVPAKVYEYLRLRRPMLALVSGGAVAELLDETGGGTPISPKDTEAIARALKQYYENRRPPGSTRAAVPPTVARYSRENLTVLLAHELDALTR